MYPLDIILSMIPFHIPFLNIWKNKLQIVKQHLHFFREKILVILFYLLFDKMHIFQTYLQSSLSITQEQQIGSVFLRRNRGPRPSIITDQWPPANNYILSTIDSQMTLCCLVYWARYFIIGNLMVKKKHTRIIFSCKILRVL